MHWIQKPAQWWKLPVLCVFSWNVGMCVYRYVDCPVSQSSRDSYFLWFDSHHTGYISFIFLSFTIDLFPSLYLFLGCILLVISNRSRHPGLKKKSFEQMLFFVFFFHVLFSFGSNECKRWTSHIVYIHNIMLPFLMSVKCVDHFVSVTSLSHVWMSRFHLCLKCFV